MPGARWALRPACPRTGHNAAPAPPLMQPSRPLRPLALVPPMAEAAAAASAAPRAGAGPASMEPSLQQNLAGLVGRSAFNPVAPVQAPLYPEIALFSQFNQLFPQAAELAQYQQSLVAAQGAQAATRGRTKSSDSKSSSAYASRHQAAEQRRRTRINERLDRLRAVVPHAERANTAAFLEEVINYIQSLQKRVQELEAKVAGSPTTVTNQVSQAGGVAAVPSEPAPACQALARVPEAVEAEAYDAAKEQPASFPTLRTGQPGTPPAQHGNGEDLSPASSEDSLPHKKRKLEAVS